MIKYATLEVSIEISDKKIIRSLYNALKPDTRIPVENCSVDIVVDEKKLILSIECKKVNQLRALHNSFLSIISMLLHIYNEVFKHESTKTPTRSPTDTRTVPST